ncbi:MAG: hypothetical protein ACP5SF_03095 [Thermoplasmata archaeon]|mgnify:CR=1 FL=1
MRSKSLIIISLIVLSLLIPISQGKAVSVNIFGPGTVGANETYEYKIVVNGFFSEYGYHLFLSGTNLTGATENELYGYSNSSNVFYVNITFPSETQTVYIFVMGIGINNGTSPVYSETNIQVKVIKSIPIYVEIKNPSMYQVRNVTVTFFLNGKYIGTTVINSIPSNGTANATFNYVGNFTQGVNTISVRINSQVLKFSNGSNVTNIYFNYGPVPNYNWVWYTFAAVVIVIIFLILIMRSNKKRPALPKWKK